jgi:hypothetical protein
MELRRTAVVKLSVSDERREDLKRTTNTFWDAAQRFADRGWEVFECCRERNRVLPTNDDVSVGATNISGSYV